MNESAYVKTNALEAKAAAIRKIVSIKKMRDERIESIIQNRIDRNVAINKKWWWPWPRPTTKEDVTEELASENCFGMPFGWESVRGSKEESLCNDIITLSNASCDGFIWLTPSHIKAMFCGV